jgi:hypothetical protein
MNGAKPKLQEIGPYVYEEKRSKNIIAYDKENDAVTYKQQVFYYFRPDLSIGSESDRIILINVPFVSTSKLARQMTNITLAYGIADRTLRQRGERLFQYSTVKEYLFDGVSVQPYIQFLSNPILEFVGRVQIPKAFEGGRFGFWKGKNGTDDGEFVIRTGRTNSKEFGRIMSWNGKTKVDHWHGQCNNINGTDGSIVPPFVSKKDLLRFFVPDICRSLLMIYEKETEFKGIKGYRFRLPDPKPVFAHKDFCFCPKNTKLECFKTGVFSLAPCREGAPVAVSGPHFLNAYEGYLKGVEGLRPDPAIHDTYLDIEPKTGLIMRAAKRLQFNVQLEPTPYMSTFARVPHVLFPFMWVEEIGEITDPLADDIRSQLIDSVELADKVAMAGLVGCSILMLIGILGCYLVTCRSKKRSESEEDLDESRSISSMSPSLSRSPSALSSTKGSSTMSRGTMTSENKGTMTDYGIEGHVNEGEMMEKVSKI